MFLSCLISVIDGQFACLSAVDVVVGTELEEIGNEDASTEVDAEVGVLVTPRVVVVFQRLLVVDVEAVLWSGEDEGGETLAGAKGETLTGMASCLSLTGMSLSHTLNSLWS